MTVLPTTAHPDQEATMPAFPDHFLSVDDLDTSELLGILDRAGGLKAARAQQEATGARLGQDLLGGLTVAMIFEKPSTRTRVSFQVAVAELGGHPLVLSAAELQLGRGETVADTGAVLSRYVHAIVVRTFAQARLNELASAATVPVVNALTDEEHPCQALADLMTVRETFGGFGSRTLTYIGDGNNVAHALLLAGAKVGLSVQVAHPEGYAPDPAVVARAQEIGAGTGAQASATTDVVDAATGAHVLYTDVWASMGQEAQAEERLAVFEPYRVTPELLARADDDVLFLHCLPAHRGEEVSAEVIDGPASRVLDQAENRLHVQKALLAALLT